MAGKVIMSFSMSFQPYQGRYLRVYNQATTLVKEGCDVTLLAWDRQGDSPVEEKRDGINIKRFTIRAPIGQGPHKNLLNMLRFNWRVWRQLMKADCDVAHCYNLDTVLTTLLAARLRRRRCVLDLCEPSYYAFWDRRFRWLLKLVNWVEASLARRYDHVLVHNLFQVDKFSRAGLKQVSQVGSYPNLYMVPEGEISHKRAAGNEVVIGRVGTIYEDNGIEELLDAYAQLLERQKARGDVWRYRLFLAGRVYDSYRAMFEQLIAPFGGQIDVHGPFASTELHKMYDRVDLAVIFVRKTPWFRHITPTKLFDAMANGVPVIGNDIGEVKEIVEEGPCGVIVDESDPQSTCDGIERLALDPQLRRQMGENARELAQKKYNWDAYRDTFLGVYRSLLAK